MRGGRHSIESWTDLLHIAEPTVDRGSSVRFGWMDTLELPIVTDGEGRAQDIGRRRRGPVARPPGVVRLLTALLGVGAATATAALLLSDRAPGVLQAVFGARAQRLWERIDASERVDAPARSELPPTDFLVHVSIWAVLATLVGLAIWSWRGLAVSALVLMAASLGLELAQGRYSTTRAVELNDAVANFLGITVGVLVAVTCYLVVSGLAGIARLLRGL